MDLDPNKMSYEVLIQYGAIGAILVFGLGFFTICASGAGYILWFFIQKGWELAKALVQKHMEYLDASIETFRTNSIALSEVRNSQEANKATNEEILKEVRSLKRVIEKAENRIDSFMKVLEVRNEQTV